MSCCAGVATWGRLSAQYADALAEHLLSVALSQAGKDRFPEFLSALARLEEIAGIVKKGKASLPKEVSRPLINPTIQIIELPWKNMASFLDPNRHISAINPVRADERVLIWYDPSTELVSARPVNDEDLLVLKMISEDILPESDCCSGRPAGGGCRCSALSSRSKRPSSFTALPHPERSGAFFPHYWYPRTVSVVAFLHAPVACHTNLRPALQTLL